MAKILEISWIARHAEKKESQSAPLQGSLRVAVDSEDDISAALATVDLPAGFKIQANGHRQLLDDVAIISSATPKAPRVAPKKAKAKRKK